MGRKPAAKPGSDQGHRRILDAACDAFATFGFEGASLRTISSNAGVLHTAMLYHFKTKNELWRAVMEDLFQDLEARRKRRAAELEDAPADRAARTFLREFIRFCAERPELHRIMTIEGRSKTHRLEWLVDHFTSRFFHEVSEMAGTLPQVTGKSDPIRLYYAIIGLAASTFTLAPEFEQLSGRNPFDPDEVEATADFVEQIIFGPEGVVR